MRAVILYMVAGALLATAAHAQRGSKLDALDDIKAFGTGPVEPVKPDLSVPADMDIDPDMAHTIIMRQFGPGDCRKVLLSQRARDGTFIAVCDNGQRFGIFSFGGLFMAMRCIMGIIC
jgi:hypothetical protein